MAFITGGASGIGLGMARSFASAGMKLVVADVETGALEAAQHEFETSNAEVLALEADVSDREALAGAARAAVAHFGKVHLVCNNAGVVVTRLVQSMTWEDWDWVMRVNLDGVVNGVQAFTPLITAHGEGGHFVNTASVAGLFPIPALSAYSASKYGVVGLSEVMRMDLAPIGIGVSVLCPGFVDTRIFDSDRNRPAKLADTGAAETGSPEQDAERAQWMQQVREGALSGDAVGNMVLDGVRENRFYILSHPELESQVETRHNEIGDAFEYWRAYRRQHAI